MSVSKHIAIVIVPGSFATVEMHDKVTNILRDKGVTVKDVELLSVNDGSRLPAATMEDDADHIRSAIISLLDSGKDVILALQSYSGFPGSEAVKGLSRTERGATATAVVGILYLASFLPLPGESLRSIMGDLLKGALSVETPGGYLPELPAGFAPVALNDLTDEAEIAEYFGRFTRHSSDSYSGKVTHAGWKNIASTQMIPEKDSVVPVPIQEAMYEKAVAEGGKVTRVFVPGAGHALAVSRPYLVVDELFKLSPAS